MERIERQPIVSAVATACRLGLASMAQAALKASARLWFLATVAGQLMFVYYIAAFYGGAALRADFPAWNKVLAHGYVAGDTTRNLALAFHLLFAAAITLFGAIQLVPQIRARFPVFHRWIGRMYVPLAFTMGLSGIYLILSGKKIGVDVTQQLALSINALLIMICAAMTWRTAVARDFVTHRRWALRLFLVVSGAWFLRVGVMFLVFVNRAPVAFDPRTFQGTTLSFLSFTQFLLPLVVLELYLRAQSNAGALGKLAMAAVLFTLTIVMGIGIVSATMSMWLAYI